MCKGSNTTSTSTAPNPQAGAAYSNLLTQAGQVASTPYTPYTGELTAPVNSQQQAGIAGVNQYAQYAQPYIQQAAGLATQAAAPITGQQIQNYENPYTQQVVNSTEAQFANTNAQQQQQVLGNSVAQGALGGDRTAVAQATLAGQQQTQEAPVIAGLESQGYNTALSTALSEQQNEAQGAYSIGNLGVSGENAALSGANAQVGAGTLEQQTQQAQDTAAYQQFLQQQAYPYQQLSFEAGIDTGVGSQLGGTSETTASAPSQLAQDFGYGALGVGSLGSLFSSSAGGTSAASGFMSALGALSDKRAKENIKKIGKLHDGQNIYRFNYKGDNATRIGLIAQEVEKKHPEAVSTGDGLKVVDYDAATKDAVRRALGGPVKGLATGGNAAYPLFGGGYGTPSTPYTGGPSWIPGLGITHGPGAPRPPQAPNQNQGQGGVQSAQQMFKNAAGLASGFGGGGTGVLPSSNPTQNLTFSPVADPTGDISDNMIYNRGGGVPVRAGLGLPSFLRRARGGFADGGAPYDQDYFDQTFGTSPQVLVPPAGLSAPQRDIVSNPAAMAAYSKQAQGDAALEYPNIGAAAAYQQQNPYAAASPAPQNAPLPPEITGPPSAGVGAAPAYAEGQPTAGLAPPQEIAPQEASPSEAVPPSHSQQQQSGFLGLSPDFYQSLMAAGAGALSSRSPYAGVGIGQGVEAGLSEYGALQKQHQSEQEQQADIQLKVRQLDQAAKAEQDKVAAETRPYSEMTAAQKADLEFKQRAEARQESQPVKIGTDLVQGDIYGVRDPNAPGGYRRIDLGQIGTGETPQGGGGQQAAPGAGANAAALPSTVDPKTGIDSKTGRNEGYLTTLPPNDRAIVKGIADYSIDPSKVGYRQKTGLQAAVANYDGSYRADIFPIIQKTEQDFAAGKQGDQVRFFNNAIQHESTLQQYATAMQNGDVRALNSLKNVVQTQLGVAAPNTFDGLKDLVGMEIVKSIVPGAGGEAERQAVGKTLAAASSPQQLVSMIEGYKELGGAQLRDLKVQYENGTFHKRNDFEDKLIPESKAVLDKLTAPPSAAPASGNVPPVAGAKLYQGKWYTRGPNGEAVPVQ